MPAIISEIIEDFYSTENLSDHGAELTNLFYDYCSGGNLMNLDSRLVNRFLVAHLSQEKNSHLVDESDIVFYKFSKFLENNYNFDKLDKILPAYELKLSLRSKHEFSKYLLNPVISHSPLTVDLCIFKKHMERRESLKPYQADIGFFEIIDLFSNNAVLIRKNTDGRFYKLSIKPQLLPYIRQNDFLKISIRKSSYSSWELENLIMYYTKSMFEFM